MISISRSFVANGAGTDLALKRTVKAGARPTGRPALIVPGYGMNSFIFGFHPDGASLEETLAERGVEVFSADLRGQGHSRPHPEEPFGLGELVDDLAKVVDHVHGLRGAKVDLIGCSLGASLAFGYLAHHAEAPVGAVVSMGGVVTWVEVPVLVGMAFASPWVAGALHISGTRRLARAVLPLLARVAPKLLSIYVNAASTDLSRADEMVQTVEDPNRTINRQIAHWVAQRDLVVRKVNVSQALARMKVPFLCVVAKNDGIVPEATARAVYDAIGSDDKVLLVVGDQEHPIAHADLFLSRGAQTAIFEPIARFLLER